MTKELTPLELEELQRIVVDQGSWIEMFPANYVSGTMQKLTKLWSRQYKERTNESVRNTKITR